MTREELCGKVDWEGGVAEAITGYGLPSSYLPDDAPQSIRDDWTAVYATKRAILRIAEWLYEEES